MALPNFGDLGKLQQIKLGDAEKYGTIIIVPQIHAGSDNIQDVDPKLITRTAESQRRVLEALIAGQARHLFVEANYEPLSVPSLYGSNMPYSILTEHDSIQNAFGHSIASFKLANGTNVILKSTVPAWQILFYQIGGAVVYAGAFGETIQKTEDQSANAAVDDFLKSEVDFKRVCLKKSEKFDNATWVKLNEARENVMLKSIQDFMKPKVNDPYIPAVAYLVVGAAHDFSNNDGFNGDIYLLADKSLPKTKISNALLDSIAKFPKCKK